MIVCHFYVEIKMLTGFPMLYVLYLNVFFLLFNVFGAGCGNRLSIIIITFLSTLTAETISCLMSSNSFKNLFYLFYRRFDAVN